MVMAFFSYHRESFKLKYILHEYIHMHAHTYKLKLHLFASFNLYLKNVLFFFLLVLGPVPASNPNLGML